MLKNFLKRPLHNLISLIAVTIFTILGSVNAIGSTRNLDEYLNDLSPSFVQSNESSGDEEKINVQEYLAQAELGDVNAQYQLATCYHFGVGGVQKNAKFAFEWCEKAALANNSEAQVLLGTFYERGLGISQDLSQAFKLYLKAAEKDDTDAQVLVASHYLLGRGVEQNDFEGFNWYQKASLKGDPQAQVELGKIYLNRKAIFESNEDPNKIAYELFLKAAKQNYTKGFLRVAQCLDEGIGVKQDKLKSYLYYREASKRYEKEAIEGNPQAQVELGKIYLIKENIVGKDNEKKAYNLFLQAAEQNYLEGLFKVAECLDDGIGIKQDKEKACHYFMMYNKLR